MELIALACDQKLIEVDEKFDKYDRLHNEFNLLSNSMKFGETIAKEAELKTTKDECEVLTNEYQNLTVQLHDTWEKENAEMEANASTQTLEERESETEKLEKRMREMEKISDALVRVRQRLKTMMDKQVGIIASLQRLLDILNESFLLEEQVKENVC